MITLTNNNTYKSDYSIADYDNYDNIEVIILRLIRQLAFAIILYYD